MPVMIVGADTGAGRKITARLLDPEREIRAFVSDDDEADRLRGQGVKVALGDVSDDSHVAGACLNCFSVVLVGEAAADSRQRAFAGSPEQVLVMWARAAESAGVQRVIWVVEGDPPPLTTPEVAVVEPDRPDLDEAVYDLDAARSL